jgi:rod shape-determining protein MreC
LFASIRKYREVLALLLLISAAVATFFAHSKDPEEFGPVLGGLSRSVLAVEAPMERGISSAVGEAIDAWQGYVALRQVRAENQTLRQRLLHLSAQLQSESDAVNENQRLRELLRFTDTAPLKTVAAPVIGDNLAPSALSRVIRIGAGQAAGIRRGMAVVSAAGAVGRVLQASPAFADVQLLVDPASAVAVRVQRSRARANVVGTGRDRRAKLEYALRSDDIEEGDTLVTSGTDGVFPPGLPVGKVVEVQRKTSATFLRAQVIPAVDPRTLEEVLVVLSQDMSPESQPAAQK